TYWYDFDALGSTAGLSNALGTYGDKYSYSPFGGILTATTAVNNPFQFVGQFGVMHEAPDIDSMRFRFTSSNLGRFITADPLSYAGRDQNLYRYAGNDPLSAIDPLGLLKFSVSVGGHIPIGPLYQYGGSLNWSSHLLDEPMSTEFGRSEDFQFGGVVDFGISGEISNSDPDLYINIGIGGEHGMGIGVGFKSGQLLPVSIVFSIGFGLGLPVTITIPENPPVNPQSASVANSFDPNGKSAAAGYAAQSFVRTDSTIPYRITFENIGPASLDASGSPFATVATAPAQRVTISDQLSSNLDWSTFRLGSMGFGDTVVSLPPDSQSYRGVVHVTIGGKQFDVQLEAGIDLATGKVYATFQSVDPNTSLPPDVLTGFLPPEDGTGQGKGYFSYTVRLKAGLPTGTQVRNVALISFDDQAVIATNQVNDLDPAAGTDPTREALNTIDAGAPTSSITAMPAQSPGYFLVQWSGQDDAGGSGIASYDVYVSDNGAPATLWIAKTDQTQGVYPGQQGHTYSFYTVAYDNVGNVETAPAVPDATTSVVDGTPPGVVSAGYDQGTPLVVGPVKYVVVRFGENVKPSLDLTDVKVTNVTTGQDLAPASLAYDVATNTAVIGFSSAIIPDGNYVLKLTAAGVTDLAGNFVDGDGDGQPEGDFTFSFFELTGDVNRDRKVDEADRQAVQGALGTAGVRPQDGDANADGNVDFNDLVALAQNYNQTGTTLPRGDFNGDGSTDFGDLVILAQHYNMGGRSDLNRDGIVDQKDLDLLNANFGKTLPAPAGVPASLPFASAPSIAAALPAGFEALFNSLTAVAPAKQERTANASEVVTFPRKAAKPPTQPPQPPPPQIQRATPVSKSLAKPVASASRTSTSFRSTPPIPTKVFSTTKLSERRKLADVLARSSIYAIHTSRNFENSAVLAGMVQFRTRFRPVNSPP
ncbi:MAG TPA: RHS repeat-associated core domain-containing protein, partial [Tepidisphaeraceae bacterium]